MALAARIDRGDFGIEDAPAWEQPWNGPLENSIDAGDRLDVDDSKFPWAHLSDADHGYLTAPREQPSPCPWCGGRLVHHGACDELRLSWQATMPWGKHKGKRLAEIPRDYLEWLARIASVNADLKEAIRRQLERTRT